MGMNNNEMENEIGLRRKKKDMQKQMTAEEISGEVDFINMDEGRISKEHPKVTRHDEKDCLFIKFDKDEKIEVDLDKLVKIESLVAWA